MLVSSALFNNCGYFTAACGCNASAISISALCAFRLSNKPDLFHRFACQRKSSMTSHLSSAYQAQHTFVRLTLDKFGTHLSPAHALVSTLSVSMIVNRFPFYEDFASRSLSAALRGFESLSSKQAVLFFSSSFFFATIPQHHKYLPNTVIEHK